MFDRVMHNVIPPALVAVGTGFLSWVTSVNWMGWAGLAVSAGWLVKGFLDHKFEVDKARGKFERR